MVAQPLPTLRVHRHALAPRSKRPPLSPADLAATIFHCLGIGPRAAMTDQQDRALVVGRGEVVKGLLG